MKASSNSEIDAFCDALWLEDGLSRNTLDSYRRDLRQFAAWLEAQGNGELLTADQAAIQAISRAQIPQQGARFERGTTAIQSQAFFPACAAAEHDQG